MDKTWNWLQRSLQCNNIHDQPMWLKKNLVIFRLINQGTLTFVMTGLNALSIILWVLQFKNNGWWMIYLCHKHLYHRTSPLGHLYSRDTSIQGAQNLVLPLKGHHYSGKGTLFWVPKPRFNFHSGDTLALETWLTTSSETQGQSVGLG